MSKSSNSEIYTNEIMGIASTLKGSKKQVSNLGNDNSLQSSLSKSSESQRNNSFNSRKIVGNLAMKLQKKTTDVVGTIAQTVGL